MSVFHNNILGGAAGAGGAADTDYQINRSLRFNSADSSYLNRTPSSAGNQKTFTFSCWAKISKLDAEKNIFYGSSNWFRFESSNEIYYWHDGSTNVRTNAKFRDPSAWYHLVLAVDTTQSTASNRVKIYVNGVQQTLSGTYPSQNATLGFNGTYAHYIGSQGASGSNAFNGYLAEVHNVDGQQLAATDFGEYDDNNVWQPKAFTGSHNASQVGSGIVYSSGVSSPDGTIANSPNDATALFDGGTSTNCQTTTAGTTVRWTPPTTTTWSTSLRIHTGAYSGSVVVRSGGTNYTLNSNGTQVASPYWLSHPNSSGTIEYIEAQGHIGAGVGYMKAIEIDGTILQDGTPAGVNGFHLDFSDNSSNSALGNDAAGSNNWTVNNLTAVGSPDYTEDGSTSGSFYTSAGGAASKMFDGDASTGAFSQTGTATFTFGASITVNTSLQVRAFKGDASGANVLINGTDISSLLNAQSSGGYSTVNVTSTLGGAPLTLSNVSVVNASGGSGNIAQIFVDGTELVDGAGTSTTDSLLDTPTNYDDGTNVGGNYCTWNPLSTDSTPTFSEGNLTVTNSGSGSSGWRNIASTMAVSSGKWYAEFDTVGSQNGGLFIGIQKVPEDNNQFNPGSFSNNFVGMTANSYALNCFSGTKRTNSSDSGYGSGMSANDRIMMAVDLDNGKIWWGKNGTWFASGDPDSGTNAAFTGLSGTFVFAHGISAGEKIHSNFGQRPFAYSNNISGFKGVCTQNLDDPTIPDGSTAFLAKTFTANASNQTITTGFSPDFVWVKSRANAYGNELYDIVRGTNKRLTANTNANEQNQAGQLTAFNSDGFTLGSASSSNYTANTASIAWTWDGGTSTVSNTDGSITSNVRANPSAGISVVTFTGDGSGTDTIGHGLNTTPEFYILKDRNNSYDWLAYTTVIDGTLDYMYLNTTGGKSNSAYTAPTSSVFSYGTDASDYVCYLFDSVKGFSQFGTYEGNNNANGPMVHTGFRPAWVMVKSINSAAYFSWVIVDSARSTYNPTAHGLFPNSSENENDLPGYGARDFYIDLLSNGFKIRIDPQSINTNNQVYFYAAFAEHPFKTARAR